MTSRSALSSRSAARFFLEVGRASRCSKKYDTQTLPLFPLMLILSAEGLLAKELEETRLVTFGREN